MNTKFLLLTSILSTYTYAIEPAIKPVDSIMTYLPAHHSKNWDDGYLKPVILKKAILSSEEKKHLKDRLNSMLISSTKHASTLLIETQLLPSAVSLGMNGVPVLDQGHHSVCSVFAITAALDAEYGKGDYISQLCYLSYAKSCDQDDMIVKLYGVIDTLKQIGIITIDYQNQYGCGNQHTYPVEGDLGDSMSLEEYQQHSSKIVQNDIVHTINISHTDPNKNLFLIKQALLHKHRIVTGNLLASPAHHAGTNAYYSKNTDSTNLSIDSWVLTSTVEEVLKTCYSEEKTSDFCAGHALIVTGYDDNATITGPDNLLHQGVVTMRSSWGEDVGDHGDFYMSYDYFKVSTGSAIVIGHLDASEQDDEDGFYKPDND